MPRMPTCYIPHGGGPCFFMEWDPPGVWDAMGEFLQSLPDNLPQQPSAIVVVSAHWQDTSFRVSGASAPELIYDYYGFPAHTYQLRYPALGSSELAERIVSLLNAAGLPAKTDASRGFDHGMFIPMMLMYPKANIPVVQLSLRSDLDPAAHLRAGQALADLRDESILILGSGMSFHNLRLSRDPRVAPFSEAFDDWLTATATAAPAARAAGLIDWRRAPNASICHPPGGEEHLLPLMVIAGAAPDGAGKRIFSGRVMGPTISAFSFG